MKESQKCACIAVFTVLVHILLMGAPQTASPLESTTRADDSHRALQQQRNVPHTSNVDLSTFSPLQTISRGGKQEHGLFTSMLWNISGSDGDRLNIPSFTAAMKYKLLVDVGLETGSGLMCMLPEHNHASKVLLGLESHPLNFGLSSHNMLKGNPSMQKEKTRIQLLPFALSNEDKYVKFNENFAPACGSILESAKRAWWCAVTSGVLHVPALTMNTLLHLVPKNYDFHFLKVDVEGAEELVLLGGLEFIPQFSMISLEVNQNVGKPNRVNEANTQRVDVLLKRNGFTYKLCEKIKSHDCHYAKTEEDLTEARKLHSLATYTPHRGEKMSKKRCREVYQERYLNMNASQEHSAVIL